MNKQSKRLEIDKRAFAIGDRKQDKSNIQWKDYIWEEILSLRVCYQKALREVLFRLYKQLQTLKPKDIYCIEG